MRKRAAAAISAQFSQAGGSVLLQVLAGQLLGTAGLGDYALAWSVIVVGTAVVSGLVGDSLTVLDRSAPSVRAGVQRCLTLLALILGCAFAALAFITGRLELPSALAFGGATIAFVVQDTLRRLLMASFRFWSIVVVDVVGLVTSVGVVLTIEVLGSPDLGTFLAALGIGQMTSTLVAVTLLPAADRWIARGVRADWIVVVRYGSWRAFQQMLRPLMLTLVRVAVTLAAGSLANGRLEAARVYVAPAMLLVSGAAGYLFASYAGDRRPLEEQVRRVDRTAGVLTAVTLAAGGLALVLTPYAGPLLTSEGDALERSSVLGWTLYAASAAVATPYGSLLAVRGRQSLLTTVRLVETGIAVGTVTLSLKAGIAYQAAPYLVAAVAVLSTLVLRFGLLRQRQRPMMSG